MVCQGVLLLPWEMQVLCSTSMQGVELELLAECHGTVSVFQKRSAFSSLGEKQGTGVGCS